MMTPEIFMKKVSKKPDGCWLWTGSVVKRSGYGQCGFNYKGYSTHRLSYIFFKGKIPKGAWVCHKCDVQLCVNPAHLFLGNPLVNRQDSVKKRRHAYGERNGCARLNENAVRLIRDARKKRIGRNWGAS